MQTDRERRLVAVAAVAEVFNRALSDVSLGLYTEALAAWPIEAVEGAMLELVRTARFFPTPVEWGEHATEWYRERQAALREERLRARALSEHAGLTEEQRAEAEARAKEMRDALAQKLGWRRRDVEAL